MAMSPWGRARCNQSPWDPFWLESCTLDPFEMMAPSPARHFGQTSRVIAGTRVDWLETDRAHIFKADLPGLKKEEINVVLEDERTLQISGERNHEEVRKGDTWHAAERSHGRFLRRFRLPENANTDAVSAKVEDGVLTVTIPKIRCSPCDRRCIMVV